MISIDGLAVEFGGTTLFSDISFVINEKDRIALMGKKWSGEKYIVENPGRCKTTYPWKNLSPQRQCHSLPSTAPYDGRRTYRIPGSGASLCPPA